MSEAVPWEELACRFGCDPQRHPVVGLYHAPEGCICFPDRIQALCGQHAIKGQQNNNMAPIVERKIPLRPANRARHIPAQLRPVLAHGGDVPSGHRLCRCHGAPGRCRDVRHARRPAPAFSWHGGAA